MWFVDQSGGNNGEKKIIWQIYQIYEFGGENSTGG
jgi:hypothetical protein